ncbi:MBL fold metallo-hydrolase [Aeoliella mucimassa]|uniref:Phosphoribosyl 1,2-cyclic phosphodiesterase n=1 Tax=Aeoliella mucimassa TaxID=2527972 RepID=A0A518ALK9_9BACT|nr:MBL fold metallo-hydrolase [Aeoliella mucimassa]QDU55625.1 Phosphoribosyl 1,2-cyclic phosphodiesterase [Aeoliella mucimassa]
MPDCLVTTDFTGEMILLGTGTSVGVPSVGCGCEVCRSPDPRNKRLRASAILGLPEGNLLIDTSPDLRMQLLREDIGLVHAVLYTHEHADHVFGLDDLRLMQFYLDGPVPLYCEQQVEQRIRQSFDYAFTSESQSLVPQLQLNPIGLEPFEVLGTQITPMRLNHGTAFEVLGFRFGNIAYCTDVNHIPTESMAKLQGLDVLILDALRVTPSKTHFTLDQAIEVAQELGAKQTYFTHVAHELEYHATNARLPEGMALAYDGLRIPLS